MRIDLSVRRQIHALSLALALFTVLCIPDLSFAADEPAVAPPPLPAETMQTAPSAVAEEKPKEGWLSWWGIPAEDALLIGMWSLHTSGDRDKRNSTQNLVGIQYRGFFASTFKNSYYDQSYFAGVTRTIYIKRFTQDLSFDITYKLGIIYGYKDHYPNLGGFSPLILPTFDLTYKMIGADFTIFPSEHPVFSVNFRFNIDRWTKGK